MTSQNQGQRRKVGRKYVIACDGTWLNSDMGFEKELFEDPTAQLPSNVTRIVRAVRRRDDDGVQQVVFYQRGIGTDDSGLENKVIGGLTGNDLSEKVREAYGFLANNFEPESQRDVLDQTKPMDDIILLGFSRGAFTARAIASLISDVGLLTRKGMEHFWGIFGDWMKQDVEGRESEWFHSQYGLVNGKKISFTDPAYRKKLLDEELTRYGMPIRAVGVWDTVGSLGIPLPWKDKNVKIYSFVNTKVAQKVQYAFHAVALDEHRNLFTPTMWEQPNAPNELIKLKQCWFPGVHANIGGSYSDAGISNITLAWMVSQLEDTDGGILAFNPDYLDFTQDLNTAQYAKVPEPVRPWGMGRLYDSDPENTLKGILQGILPITRTPGRYNTIDLVNGKQTHTRLKGTNETIHRSVRVRINGGGRPVEEDPMGSDASKLLNLAKNAIGLRSDTYVSAALRNYTLEQPDSVKTETDHSSKGSAGVIWRSKDGLGDLNEEELGETESRLLKRSVATAS